MLVTYSSIKISYNKHATNIFICNAYTLMSVYEATAVDYTREKLITSAQEHFQCGFLHKRLFFYSTSSNVKHFDQSRGEEEKWANVSLVIRMQINTKKLRIPQRNLSFLQKLTFGHKFLALVAFSLS